MTTGTSQILPFANDSGANVMTQAAYLAASQRTLGNQPGIAQSQLVNKALRQFSAILAGFGQFMANRQSSDVTDSLTPTQVETILQNALVSHSTLPGNISGSSQSWWRKSSDGYMEQGVSGIAVPANGGTVVVTFPVAFSTVILDVQVSVQGAAHEQLGWSSPGLSSVTIETGNGDTLARTANIVVRGY